MDKLKEGIKELKSEGILLSTIIKMVKNLYFSLDKNK